MFPGNVVGVPNPGGDSWTILFGAHSGDDDEEEIVGIIALTDAEDLPGVTEQEFRFELYEDSEENPHAIYFGVGLHRHGEESDDDGPGCEMFHADDGETDLDDVPDDLKDGLGDMLDMGLHAPGEEPVDAEPVTPEDLIEPDTDPGGMYQ